MRQRETIYVYDSERNDEPEMDRGCYMRYDKTSPGLFFDGESGRKQLIYVHVRILQTSQGRALLGPEVEESLGNYLRKNHRGPSHTDIRLFQRWGFHTLPTPSRRQNRATATPRVTCRFNCSTSRSTKSLPVENGLLSCSSVWCVPSARYCNNPKRTCYGVRLHCWSWQDRDVRW
jgi:hypothetical protein